MEPKEKKYMVEAKKISYGTRSLFFLRKLKEGNFQRLAKEVVNIFIKDDDWHPLENFGITSSSWSHIKKSNISPPQIFCHPQIIIQAPRLIAYYRGVASISQKGLQQLAFGTSSLEKNPNARINEEKAEILSKVLNELISALIDSDKDFSKNDILMLLFATAGVQIDGSWRNRIGEEAAFQVKEMITKYFYKNNLIEKIILGSGELAKPAEELIEKGISGFMAKNEIKIVFGSEPDVSVFGKKDKLIGIIEVKGGLDEAGALERYGAAKKTFDEALNRNPQAFTMYLASCITPTVKKRISADRSVRKIVNLTNVLFNDKERLKFLEEIRWWTRL